jgi:hypothetical protein
MSSQSNAIESFFAAPEPFVTADEAARFSLCEAPIPAGTRPQEYRWSVSTGNRKEAKNPGLPAFRTRRFGPAQRDPREKTSETVRDRFWQSPLKRGLWLISEDHLRKYAARKERPGCCVSGSR